MADPTSNVPDTTDQPDGSDPTQAAAPVAPASTDDSTQTGVNPGYAKARATGAVKFTDVVPGGKFNGVVVPENAASTDGQKFYDKTGAPLSDSPYDADGEPNMLSSAYISDWAQNALKRGVNPIIISEFIKPWSDMATATKDFENRNSDSILMRQGLQQENQSKALDLNNKWAETIGTSNNAVGLGLIQQLRQAKPTGAPDSPVLMQFGVQPTDTPAQALQKIKASGPAVQANAALASTRAATAAATQGVSTSQITNATELNGAYTQENGNYNTLSQTTDKLTQAKQYIDNMIANGSKGGGFANRWQDFKNEFGVGTPEYATVQSVLAANAPPQIRQAIGAGNRMGQTEFNNLSGKLSDGSMPLPTLSTILGNSINYNNQQTQISGNRLNSYEQIAKQHQIELTPRTAPPAAAPITPEKNSTEGGKIFKVVAPNGKSIVSIPESNLKAALARGAKLVPGQ